MSLRRLAFDGPEVTLGVLGAENYWESYRAAYRLYASRLDGATGVSHSLQLGRYFESGQLSLALSYGDEIESLGNGQVLRTKSTVVALAGAILIDGRNELLCEAGWQDLDTLYERLWLRLGLRRRW
jgi:YaiO family outer membrane protein